MNVSITSNQGLCTCRPPVSQPECSLRLRRPAVSGFDEFFDSACEDPEDPGDSPSTCQEAEAQVDAGHKRPKHSHDGLQVAVSVSVLVRVFLLDVNESLPAFGGSGRSLFSLCHAFVERLSEDLEGEHCDTGSDKEEEQSGSKAGLEKDNGHRAEHAEHDSGDLLSRAFFLGLLALIFEDLPRLLIKDTRLRFEELPRLHEGARDQEAGNCRCNADKEHRDPKGGKEIYKPAIAHITQPYRTGRRDYAQQYAKSPQ